MKARLVKWDNGQQWALHVQTPSGVEKFIQVNALDRRPGDFRYVWLDTYTFDRAIDIFNTLSVIQKERWERGERKRKIFFPEIREGEITAEDLEFFRSLKTYPPHPMYERVEKESEKA